MSVKSTLDSVLTWKRAVSGGRKGKTCTLPEEVRAWRRSLERVAGRFLSSVLRLVLVLELGKTLG